jgi:hypothetical protein
MEGATMTRLVLDISMSLDGFVAGPNPSLEQPLGEGGDRLHEWGYDLASWRERHGLTGGETNRDAEVLQESIDATGAIVMGRRMFSGGEGAWEDDPRADGWWETSPLSACRSSSSPITPGRAWPSRERPRTPSSRTVSRPPSSRLGRPPGTRTSR